MTAMQALKSELRKLQQAYDALQDEYGVIPVYYNGRACIIAEQINNLNGSIEWFTKLKQT